MLWRSSPPCLLWFSLLLFFSSSLFSFTSAASSTPLSPAGPYICRCTCFVTNTTLVPLYAPVDPKNPCSTCTRQFCLNQGLQACRGARIERPDADTGTGWEGEVWARCLQPTSSRDKLIISLYVVVVASLLVWTIMRDRIQSFIGDHRIQGAGDVYRAVRNSPWLQQSGLGRSSRS